MVFTINKSICKLLKFFDTLCLPWWGKDQVCVHSCQLLYLTPFLDSVLAAISCHCINASVMFYSPKDSFSDITLYQQQEESWTEEISVSPQIHQNSRVVEHTTALDEPGGCRESPLTGVETAHGGAETCVGAGSRQDNLNENWQVSGGPAWTRRRGENSGRGVHTFLNLFLGNLPVSYSESWRKIPLLFWQEKGKIAILKYTRASRSFLI